jgi:hypothetical protein
MPTETKIERLASLLIRETVEGRIEWESKDPPRSLTTATDTVILSYCQTEYKNQNIVVYERRFRSYDGERDTSYWAGAPGLGIVQYGEIVWENFETIPILWSLLKVAKEAAAGIDDLLDDLVK